MKSAAARTDLFFLPLFLVISGFYLFWTWNPELGGLGGDNGFYLLMARFYSPWSPASDIALHFTEHSQYPPFYPIILALFGGGESILAAHLTTTACFLLALLVFRAWLPTLGLQKSTANLTVLLIAILPGTVKFTMFILSENLFLALSILALYLVALSEKNAKNFFLPAAAAIIVLAVLTRTAGLALAAAFCFHAVLKRPPKGLVSAFGVIVSLAFLFWHKSLSTVKHTGYLDALASYYDGGTAAKILGQIQKEAFFLWQGWQANFEPAFGLFLIESCFVFSLAAMFYRIYKQHLDGFYLLLYFVIILLWPYPAEAKRLIYGILPILVGQSIFLLNRLAAFQAGKFKIYPVTLLILSLVFCSLPNTLVIADRLRQPLPPELEKYRRTKHLYTPNPQTAANNLFNAAVLMDDIKSLAEKLPEKAVVYGILPSIISLYTNRLAFIPPDDITTANSIYYQGDNSRPVFFYLIAMTSPSIPTPYYPLEKIRDRMEILHLAKAGNGGNAPVIAILARLTPPRQISRN